MDPCVYVSMSPVLVPWPVIVICSLLVLTDAGATENVVAVVSIAISPALASSIASLSAVEVTDVILKGR